MNGAFRVLVVCTGNICRSPVAEHLLRAGLADGAFDVTSAGTLAHDGDPMEPYAVDALAELGLDGTGFRARALSAEQITDADLVLTATREHRAAVASLVAGAASRTFTLLECARLAVAVDPALLPPGDPVPRARALVPAVLALRGRPAVRPRDDDLTDPYGGPRRGFTACAATIDQALRPVLELVLRPA